MKRQKSDKQKAADERLVARYVDGELRSSGPQRDEQRPTERSDEEQSRAELAAFERRLLAEPALRQAVEEQRSVREWFQERKSGEQLGAPPPGFAAAVAERTRRLPSRAELQAELGPLGEDDEFAIKRLAQRLVVAAALIFGLSMLVWGGLIKQTDPRHLQASDRQVLEQIDRAIETDALHRDAARGK